MTVIFELVLIGMCVGISVPFDIAPVMDDMHTEREFWLLHAIHMVELGMLFWLFGNWAQLERFKKKII